MPSSANPHLSKDEIEAMRADMSDRAYQQEIEAQFLVWEGAVFSRIRESITSQPEGSAAIIGVDWAGSSGSGDYTALITLSSTGHVLDITRLRGEPFVQQRARLRGIWERCGRPPTLAEENGMGAVQNAELRQLDMRVEDFTTTNASKTMIVSKLVQAFEQGNIHIPDDEHLLAELQAFQCTPLAGGTFRYGAPPGLHDDLVMALCIAYSGLGNAARRESDSRFFKSVMDVNAGLTKSGSGMSWGDDRTPSDYPEGGNSVWSGMSPFNPSRWSH